MLDEEADEAADAVDDDEDASRTSSDENCNDEWTDEEFAPPIFVLDPLQEPQNDSWLRAKSARPTSDDKRVLCDDSASSPMAKTYAGATDLKELKIPGKALGPARPTSPRTPTTTWSWTPTTTSTNSPEMLCSERIKQQREELKNKIEKLLLAKTNAPSTQSVHLVNCSFASDELAGLLAPDVPAGQTEPGDRKANAKSGAGLATSAAP